MNVEYSIDKVVSFVEFNSVKSVQKWVIPGQYFPVQMQEKTDQK